MRSWIYRVVMMAVAASILGCTDSLLGPDGLQVAKPEPRRSMVESGANITELFPNATNDPTTWPTSISYAKTYFQRRTDGTRDWHPVVNGSMVYSGTHWRMTPLVSVSEQIGNSVNNWPAPVHPVTGVHPYWPLVPVWELGGKQAHADWPVFTKQGCGYTVQAGIHFEVWVAAVDLSGSPIELFRKNDDAYDELRAAACPPQTSCIDKTETNVAFAVYDPYGSGDATAGCGETDGTGGDDGGGTQYNPGDQTNGEMVDWNTGVGTGMPSNCPDAAPYVEYLCFEFEWTTNSGETKRETRCGYVTVCG